MSGAMMGIMIITLIIITITMATGVSAQYVPCGAV